MHHFKAFRLALIVTGLASLALAHTAFADDKMDRALQQIEPEERAHQACGLRGLEQIRKGTRLKGIDRLKTSSRKRATFKDNIVTANGAAVRANHRWYALTYTCTVTDDQMKAKAFEFQIGAEIPEDQWEDFGLW